MQLRIDSLWFDQKRLFRCGSFVQETNHDLCNISGQKPRTWTIWKILFVNETLLHANWTRFQACFDSNWSLLVRVLDTNFHALRYKRFRTPQRTQRNEHVCKKRFRLGQSFCSIDSGCNSTARRLAQKSLAVLLQDLWQKRPYQPETVPESHADKRGR